MKNETLEAKVAKLNIGQYQRHIVFCSGNTCCGGDKAEGDKIWEFLKNRLKELNLSEGAVFRTRATCLRICQQGPIAVVYPEGTWYKNLNQENLERVIQQHLLKGRPVTELSFAENPLMLDM